MPAQGALHVGKLQTLAPPIFKLLFPRDDREDKREGRSHTNRHQTDHRFSIPSRLRADCRDDGRNQSARPRRPLFDVDYPQHSQRLGSLRAWVSSLSRRTRVLRDAVFQPYHSTISSVRLWSPRIDQPPIHCLVWMVVAGRRGSDDQANVDDIRFHSDR